MKSESQWRTKNERNFYENHMHCAKLPQDA